MKLVKARPLAEYREGEDDMAGREARQARRRYRKARRKQRDQDKARELRQKARSLEEGGKRRKKKRGKGGQAEPERPEPSGPRRFPGGFPGRGGGFPGRERDQGWSDEEQPNGELEPVEPEEDEPDPEEVFPEEEVMGRSGWGPAAKLGEHLRIQAEDGYRAAVILLRPGLYLVAEVSDEATRPALGFAPLLAPLIMRSASKALQRRESAQPEPASPGTAIVRRDPSQGALVPAATVGWAEPEDVAALLGCEVCDHGKRR